MSIKISSAAVRAAAAAPFSVAAVAAVAAAAAPARDRASPLLLQRSSEWWRSAAA